MNQRNMNLSLIKQYVNNYNIHMKFFRNPDMLFMHSYFFVVFSSYFSNLGRLGFSESLTHLSTFLPLSVGIEKKILERRLLLRIDSKKCDCSFFTNVLSVQFEFSFCFIFFLFIFFDYIHCLFKLP